MDTISIDYIPPTLPDGIYVYANAGDDDIYVGTTTGGMSTVARPLFIDAGTGMDEMWLRDAANTTANMAYTINRSGIPNWEYSFHRAASGVGIPNVEFKGLDGIALATGVEADVVRLEAIPQMVTGITLETNGGNDTIHIGYEDTAGITGPGMDDLTATHIYVDGGAGTDRLYYQDTKGANVLHHYTFETAPAGWDLRLNWAKEPDLGTSRTVDSRAVEEYTLNASPGQDDPIRVRKTPSTVIAPQGLHINAGGGDNLIIVGNDTTGLDDINTAVTIDGQAGDNRLIIDNRGGANKILSETNTSITRGDGKIVHFTNVRRREKLVNGAGNVNIQAKAAGIDQMVHFEGGGNSLALGNGELAFLLGGPAMRSR